MSTAIPRADAEKAAGSLSRNVLFNVVAYLTTVVMALLVSPSIIRNLGDSRYGAWALVGELIGYSGLLDFGVRWAVSYYVTQHLARREWAEMGQLLNSAMALLMGLGALIASAGISFAFLFAVLFKVDPHLTGEIRWALSLLGIVLGLSFPLEVYSAILYGYRRVYVQSSIEIAYTLTSGIGFLIVTRQGRGLIALALVQISCRLACWAVRIGVARRLLGAVRIWPHVSDFAVVRRLLSLGSRSFLISVARTAFGRVQVLVVGAAVSVEMIARYRIGASLVEYLFAAVGALSLAFTPHFTYLLARQESGKVRQLFFQATRLTGLVALMIPAYMLIFGSQFLSLWIHPRYVHGAVGTRSDVVMFLILIGFVPRFIQSISWQLVTATGKLDTLLRLTMAEAVSTTLLSLLLVGRWGIIGVAVGTAIPMFISNVFIVPVYVMRSFDIHLTEYFRRGLLRPLLCGCAALASAAAITHLLRPASWGSFALAAGLTLVVGAGVVFAVGLEAEDRQLAREKLAGLLGGRAG